MNTDPSILYQKCFLNSYYRGVIDGDGSVGINSKNKYPWANISTASKLFANDIINGVKEKFDLRKYGEQIYQVNVCGGRDEIKKFLKWIYKNKRKFYLERKYEKIKDLIN